MYPRSYIFLNAKLADEIIFSVEMVQCYIVWHVHHWGLTAIVSVWPPSWVNAISKIVTPHSFTFIGYRAMTRKTSCSWIQELKPQNLLSLEIPLRGDKRIASVQSWITYIINIYLKNVAGILYGRHQGEKMIMDAAYLKINYMYSLYQHI